MLLGFAVLMATGQILFKITAGKIPLGLSADTLSAIVRVPQFWIAMFLYGSATILWILILQKVPLSRAYMVMALAFVLVPGVAAVFFGEHLSWRFMAGAAMIMAGVVLTSYSGSAG